MVVAQGLGNADCQAPRDEKGDRSLAPSLAVIMHRIWVDGTEFRWTREQVPAAPSKSGRITCPFGLTVNQTVRPPKDRSRLGADSGEKHELAGRHRHCRDG